MIISEDLDCVKGQNSVELKFEDLNDGIYFIILTVNNQTYNTKLVKITK